MADTMHDGLVDLLPHDHSKLKNLTPTGLFDMKVELDSYFVKCFVIGRETSVLSAELNWDDEDDWFGLFVQVFMSLPVVFHGGYLFRLHIETDLGDISETDWCTVLAAFPSITTLMVRDLSHVTGDKGYEQPIFFRLLGQTQADSQDSILCPNLQELHTIPFSVKRPSLSPCEAASTTAQRRESPSSQKYA